MNRYMHYLDEYSSKDAVKRYSMATAGDGIHYLLEQVYGPLYLDSLSELYSKKRAPLRLLEFGCGVGMNLMYVVKLLSDHNIPLEIACGADFSSVLIDEAKEQAKMYLGAGELGKVRFYVASNENLLHDLCGASGQSKEGLAKSFDFVLGVNTIRYAHRLEKQDQCVNDIYHLLSEEGRCLIIDMNNKFPYFLRTFWNAFKKGTGPKGEKGITFKTKYVVRDYLPNLEGYARPFKAAGFEILVQKNFCWVPHSARGIRLQLARFVSPFLDAIAPAYAMRSLIIAKKPS